MGKSKGKTVKVKAHASILGLEVGDVVELDDSPAVQAAIESGKLSKVSEPTTRSAPAEEDTAG